jgi:flagellar basal-body rod protein FlgF
MGLEREWIFHDWRTLVDYGIYLAASGFLGQQKRLEIIANNLANANTAGYKADMPVFRIAAPSSATRGPGWEGPASFPTPMATPHVATDFSQGPLTQTGNPLHVALVDEGFFEVQTPQGPRYTRKGDFTRTADGRLVTHTGHPVMGEGGPITLTEGEITIDRSGSLFVDEIEQGRFRVVTFRENGNLVKEGDSLFAPAGETPDVLGAEEVEVRQGYLEGSNVNAIREMILMVEALRSFEDHQKMIHTFDSAHQSAVNEIGRLR